MKKARDDKPISTIPEAVYESGIINKEIRKSKNNDVNDITTDVQGNGYPMETKNGSKNTRGSQKNL